MGEVRGESKSLEGYLEMIRLKKLRLTRAAAAAAAAVRDSTDYPDMIRLKNLIAASDCTERMTAPAVLASSPKKKDHVPAKVTLSKVRSVGRSVKSTKGKPAAAKRR